MQLGDQRCVSRCCACYKSNIASCKTCVLSNMSFYSKRMALDKSMQVKKDRGQEIESLLGSDLKLEEDKHTAISNIRSLEYEIERRKSVLEEKRKLIQEFRFKKDIHKKQIESLKATVQKVKMSVGKMPKNQKTRDENLLDLEKQRTLYCRYMYGIYPLKKVDDVYVIRSAGLHSTSPGAGSILNRFYTNSSLAMKNYLPSAVSSLKHNSLDPHSLALLVFSSHLVLLLAHILDLRLPSELNAHSLISTSKAFRSQWTKLSICVSHLCSSLGVKASDPHNSLICLFEKLCEGPIRVNSSLPLTQFEPSQDQSDMEESNEWDTCDDLDPLTTSVMAPHGFFKQSIRSINQQMQKFFSS